ncbi:MAG: hypothetical protein ACFCU5_09810 [Pleurocapsa sp.]
MLKCPACKASYEKEVSICKRCNLSEDNIRYIDEINQDNPIFICISFLVQKQETCEKNNYQQLISKDISHLQIKVENLTTEQQQNRQKIETLEKIVSELQLQIQNKDNSQNISLDTQEKSKFLGNFKSAESIEHYQNNYDGKDISTIEEKNWDNNIVPPPSEGLLNSNNNLLNMHEDIYDNEISRSEVSQIINTQISQLVKTYNINKNSFDKNTIARVGETSESSGNRIAGRSEEIFLLSTSKGNYWIVEENNNFYLFPHSKIIINEHSKRYTIDGLFECNDSSSGDYNFQLIHPAKVTKLSSELWRLEEKGKLEFL